MVARVFAVLASAFLVASVGFALLAPSGLSLGRGIELMLPTALDWARSRSMSWLWLNIEVPFLLRPLWLVPACLGLLCAGIAGSLNFKKSTNTRHRRS